MRIVYHLLCVNLSLSFAFVVDCANSKRFVKLFPMGKLKGIPFILSPDILHLLASSGHGDEIVLADINFPVKSICKSGPTEHRADGLKIPDLLEAILHLMPLDGHVEKPICVMKVMDQDESIKDDVAAIWSIYSSLTDKAENKKVEFEILDRFEFYERSKNAHAIIQTGDMAPYANIIIKRGVVNN